MTGDPQGGPEQGPRILFFSGGTALRGLARSLAEHTHNAVHLITPFDSGGSSATLRAAFHMPAVGDIRNRLMALADQTLPGSRQIVDLFATRLSKAAHNADLRLELVDLAQGVHPLAAAVPGPMRTIIRHLFQDLLDRPRLRLDLRGASLGNLALASAYLANGRRLDPAIELFSMLVRPLGEVRAVAEADLHLAAELENGQTVLGQHRLTGKDCPGLDSPVRRLWLTRSLHDPAPAACRITPSTAEVIQGADLIGYPMGSFHTSLCACLLPEGVGRAVARAACPKVYIPNSAPDPESAGYDLDRRMATLLELLGRDAPKARAADLLETVLLDDTPGRYGPEPDLGRWTGLGLRFLRLPLVSPESAPFLDPGRLARAVADLARGQTS